MNFKIFFQIYIVKLLFPKYFFLPTSLIYSKAKHETGNFTSNIYKQNKNLFGMKLPRVRNTTAIKTRYNHAVYNTNIQSIYDYFLRQEHFNIIYKDSKQYVEDTFKSSYAEDKDYREKWLAHYYSLGLLRYFGYFIVPTIISIPAVLFFDYKFFKGWKN